MRTKIVEKGGAKLKNLVVKKNPFKTEECLNKRYQFVNPHQSQILLIKALLESHVEHPVLYMNLHAKSVKKVEKHQNILEKLAGPSMSEVLSMYVTT